MADMGPIPSVETDSHNYLTMKERSDDYFKIQLWN